MRPAVLMLLDVRLITVQRALMAYKVKKIAKRVKYPPNSHLGLYGLHLSPIFIINN